METAFVITPHVVNTLNSLPEQERVAVTSALAVELLLGTRCQGELSPMQEVIYTRLSHYVRRDTERFNARMSAHGHAVGVSSGEFRQSRRLAISE